MTILMYDKNPIVGNQLLGRGSLNVAPLLASHFSQSKDDFVSYIPIFPASVLPLEEKQTPSSSSARIRSDSSLSNMKVEQEMSLGSVQVMFTTSTSI